MENGERCGGQVGKAWPVVPLAVVKSDGLADDHVKAHSEGNEGSYPSMHSGGGKRTSADIGKQVLLEIMGGGGVEYAPSGKRKLWVETTHADFFFGGWICVNAVVLALETDFRTPDNENHPVWVVLDSVFNVVFLVELVLRMYAQRRRWWRDHWNIFDFVLVVVGVTDSWILPVTGAHSDMRFITLMRLFRLFRLIRVLRVLRLLRFLKELMLLIEGITSAMRAMVWGLLLLGITIFICALLLTRLVGKACCESHDTFSDELYHNLFGSLPRTSFTLFQFTMEFQPDICRDTWDYGPWLTLFFLAYTMFTNITLLNTVASVIVENILSISQQNSDDAKAQKFSDDLIEADARLSKVFSLVDSDNNRMIDIDEITKQNPQVRQLLAMSGVTIEQAVCLFSVMDINEDGLVDRDEFQDALVRTTHPLEAFDVLKLECRMEATKAKLTTMFQDVSKQNQGILEALCRMEAKQQTLEEKFTSARQPDPRDLDGMSISFVPKLSVPKLSLPVPRANEEEMDSLAGLLEPSGDWSSPAAQFHEETLLV